MTTTNEQGITLNNRNEPLTLLSVRGDDFIAHAIQQMASKEPEKEEETKWFLSEEVRCQLEDEIPFNYNLDETLTKEGKEVAIQIANQMLRNCLNNRVWDWISEEINNLLTELAMKAVKSDSQLKD